MKLGISNIAWSAAEAPEAYRVLAERGVHGIEAAPGILFPDSEDPLKPSPNALKSALDRAQAFGHRFVSMQAVHFGRSDVALFGTQEERHCFLQSLRDAIDLAAELSIGNIVLGSPRNRVRPESMTADEALLSATAALQSLGDHAACQNVSIALEANPRRYGTNFLTHFEEACRLSALIAHPAIGVNFDLGERLINRQTADIGTDMDRSAGMLKHVQISAPDLLPPLDNLDLIKQLGKEQRRTGFPHWTTVEMRRTSSHAIENMAKVLDAVVAAIS